MILKGVSLIAVALAANLACAGEAEAAAPDLLCVERDDAPAAYPSGQALLQAASAAEAALDDGSAAAERALQLLEVPTAGAEPPSAEALAAYCAAAGEAMRIGPRASQYQAQIFLFRAFRAAQQAQSEQLGSRAAFRLGLVSQFAPSVADTRSKRSRAVSAPKPAIAAVPARRGSRGRDPCSGLDDPDVLTRTSQFVSFQSFRCAASRAQAGGQWEVAALANLKLARVSLGFAESDPDNAEAARRAATPYAMAGLEAAASIANPALRAELLGRLASVAIDLGLSDNQAVRGAPDLMRAADGANPGTRAFAAGLRARLALAAGQTAQAAPIIREAILMESQRALPARLPEWYLLLGEAEPANRAAHAAAAYRALESVRPLLPRIDPITDESAFSLYMRPVFERAADVQLAAASGANEGVVIRAAQEIVEASRSAELQSVFGSECVPPREALRVADLRPGEVLLYPILLPDRIELLYAVGGGDGSYKRLPANRAADRAAVSRLVTAMVESMKSGRDESWRQPARQLYDLLIKPVESELRAGSVLAIIPDGPLRAVPFAALMAPDGRYLVQRTRLTVTPSLAYSQAGGTEPDQRPSVLAASLQKEMILPAGEFAELKGTAEEAKIAAGTGRDSRLIQDFKRQDLNQALVGNKVDILHLATHASFNGRSDRAFIVANGEVIMLSELRAILAQNRTRGEQLDLLVLSACETAVGDDEASMGLAGAAVQAGATSAIASLWQVDDAGTAELMRNFYDRVRAGRSKSEAIREAQLALLESGGDNADPFVWAAFTLLGAWR